MLKKLNAILLSLSLLITPFSLFKPSFAEARASKEVSNVVLVDNFDKGRLMNQLGGAFGAATQGGDSKIEFLKPALYSHAAESSYLHLRYEITASSGYSFLWIKLGASTKSPEVTSYLDLSQMNFLTFRYKTNPAPLNFKIEIHEDKNKDGRFDFNTDQSSFVYIDGIKKYDIGDGWTKALVPLKRFNGITDWRKILELVFVFEKDRAGAQGDISLDDLLFIRPELKHNPAEASAFVPFEINKITVNGKDSSQPFSLEGKNEIVLDYVPAADFSNLEAIRLEINAPGSDEWIPVAVNFSPASSGAVINWEAYDFSPPSSFSLRLSAENFFGQSNPLAGPWEGLSLPALSDESFLDLASEKAFRFFVDYQNPINGLFYDTSAGGDASIAVTGFGLTALVIGAERGWISKKDAEKRVRLCLNTFEKKMESKEGFYYHFVDAKTLKRSGTSEISTVDTALFIAGALTAGEYFGGKTKKKADKLYKRINWPFFINKNPDEEHYMHFHHGWTPEEGISEHAWDYFTDETLLLTLLGMGSDTHPAPAEVFYRFVKRQGNYNGGEPFVYSWHGGLFSYQYANAWFDFRSRVDKEGINWFENSKRATLANRAFTIDHAGEFQTYDGDSWGITSMRIPERYVMHYGPLPNGENKAVHDGTVSPSGPAGSMPFTPYLSLRALKHFYHNYPEVWGIYGFRDSLNIDRKYTSPVYYGLGQGILLLGIENFRTGFIWNTFSKSKFVQAGLEKAEFRKVAPAEDSSKAAASAKILAVFQAASSEDAKRQAATDFIKSNPDYKDAVQFFDAAAESFKQSSVFSTAKLYAELSYLRLKGLQLSDLELGREYLRVAGKIKNETLGILEKSQSFAANEADKLELLKTKIHLLNDVQDFGALEAAKEEAAVLFTQGLDSGAFNLSWALKWAEGLDQETAVKLRRSAANDLDSKEIGILTEALLQKAKTALNQQRFSEAADLYDELTRLYAMQNNQKALINFLERTGKQFSAAARYGESEKFYQMIIDTYGLPEDKERAIYRIAGLREKVNDKQGALKLYEEFLRQYPESRIVPDVLMKRANVQSSLGEKDKAVASLRQVVDAYRGTSYAQESYYLMGMVYFHAARYSEAIKVWEDFLKQYPNSRRVPLVQDYLERADKAQTATA